MSDDLYMMFSEATLVLPVHVKRISAGFEYNVIKSCIPKQNKIMAFYSPPADATQT